MSASRLDAVYRSILITKFFTKGWGKPDNLKRLFEFRKVVSNREECYKLISPDYPVTITKEEKRTDFHLLEGHFHTPMEYYLPGVVPPCAQKAHFQIVMPASWSQTDYKPMCLHLAGTGDHFFWRRRNFVAKPLLKEAGIGAIILENPFYGLRKPQDQVRSSLHNVSDIFVMGGCLILETLVLLHWCERNGLGPLGVTGLSMGGHMASLAATNWPKPLVLVPCLSWSTASAVFTKGVMSNSINWELLETQFFADGEYRDKLAKMVTVVDEAFIAGRKFAQHFSKTKDLFFDMRTFNLNNANKKFDITNPNNVSSCQGFLPEESQKYSVMRSDDEKPNGVSNAFTSLEMLKDTRQLSDNLYKKITSSEKFELESSEIKQINELAFQSTKLSWKSVNNTSDGDKSILNGPMYQTPKLESKNATTININDKCLNDLSMNSLTIPKEAQKTQESNEKSTLNNLTKNILSNIPFIVKQKENPDVKWRNREALQFMRGVMDEFTHLGNFSIPYDTSLIIAVCAKNDAYVPRGDTGTLEELWPGAEVRFIDAGHVAAYVLHQNIFRSSIIEAFEKSKTKWIEKNKEA